MSKHYKRIDVDSLKGEILIEIRKYHTKEIVKELIKKNIVSQQYIDGLLKINALKNNIIDDGNIFNDDARIELLEKLLLKECCKGTAKLINELCTKT